MLINVSTTNSIGSEVFSDVVEVEERGVALLLHLLVQLHLGQVGRGDDKLLVKVGRVLSVLQAGHKGGRQQALDIRLTSPHQNYYYYRIKGSIE